MYLNYQYSARISLPSCSCFRFFCDFVTFLDADLAVLTFQNRQLQPCMSPPRGAGLISHRAIYEGWCKTSFRCTPKCPWIFFTNLARNKCQ